MITFYENNFFPSPVGSIWERLEAVGEALVGRYGTLSDVADAIHPRRVEHKQAVPVHRDAVSK